MIPAQECHRSSCPRQTAGSAAMSIPNIEHPILCTPRHITSLNVECGTAVEKTLELIVVIPHDDM